LAFGSDEERGLAAFDVNEIDLQGFGVGGIRESAEEKD